MRSAHSPLPLHRLFSLVPVALALAACGGGGTDNSSPVAPPIPATLTLTGTAATGAAIGGMRVDAKCGGGTAGNGTSQADGAFTVTVAAGQLPCVLQVTTVDGTVLHSLATGSGSAARANITPASELVVASLSAGTPASYYSGFVASTATALTQAKVDAAVQRVGDTLAAAGAALPAGVNLLTAPLKAANGSTAGDALDTALDALKTKLASGAPGTDFKTALAALADAVAKASPDAPVSALSNTASLPPDMLLQPAASNCSALRSGKYRLVYNRNHAAGSHDTTVLTIDAPKLTVVDADGTVTQLTAAGHCRFKTPENGDMAVSQAGVIVAQIQAGSSYHLGVAFPVQTHPLSALAGEWNSLQLDRTEDQGPIILTHGTWTVDTAGKLTAATYCENGADCFTGTLAATPGFPVITSSINADGGFNRTGSAGDWTDRVFLYKTGGGELLSVSLTDAGGHLSLSTRKVVNPQPTVGDVRQAWNFTQNNNYTASGASEGKNTIRSVDATANSYLRDAVTNLTTGVTRPETFRINNPREGYNLRVGETVTASDASSSTVTSFIAMGLRGTGLTVVGFPSTNTLVLSVGK